MTGIVLAIFALYLIAFLILSSKVEETNVLMSEIVHQNLIVGAVAQLARYIN